MPLPSPAPVQPTIESPCPPPKMPDTSKGNKLFNWLTYGGIAGIGTFVATIPMAYWQKYKGGAKWYQSAAEGLSRIGLPKTATEKVLETTSLMHGGNLMLVPVVLAENNKVALVKKANLLLDDTSDPQSIEEAPKQTFSSILKGRITAWLAVFAGLSTAGKAFPKSFQTFEEEFGTRVCGIVGAPTHIAGEETRAFRLGKIAAIDSFATVAASIILFFGSHFFAKQEEKKHTSSHPSLRPLLPTEHTTSANIAPTNTALPSSRVENITRIEGMLAPAAPLLDKS